MEEKADVEELAHLRKRVKDLEAQLRARKRGSKADDKDDKSERLGDAIGDAARQYHSDSARYLRGVTLAYMEGLRLASQSVTSMANEIASQQAGDKEKKNESASDLLMRLPSHATAGVSKAIEESVDIPRKVIDKFYEHYSTPEPSEPAN